MLPEGLQSAESPAETLADELACCFRSFRPGDGFFIVADAPTEAPDRDGQIGVLRDGVRGDAADGFNGFLAPGTERSRHDGDAIQQMKSALLHVLAGDVFERLPAREPARAIADLDVAGDRADGGIREMAHQLADGVGFDFRVSVDGDDNLGVRLGHGEIERCGFSAIHLMNDAHARFMGEIRVQKFAGLVGGAVIDHDNPQVFQVRQEDRSDGLHDDVFFVVRGDQHGHARRRFRHHGAVGAQLFDDGEQTDDHGSPTHQYDAEDEDRPDRESEPLEQQKNKSVRACFEALFGGKGQHHFRARFSNQVRHRYELVASRAQLVDDLRQGSDGLAAVPAAIVEEHDVALLRLREHAIHNFFCWDWLPITQAPVVGVDALTNDQVAQLLRIGKLRNFFGIFRLVIDAVGRPEKNGLCADGAFDEPLRQVQFPTDLCVRNFVEFRVRKSVVPDFVAFRVLALQNVRPAVRFVANDEESAGHILLFQNVQHLGGPLRIRAIVERKSDFLVRGADLIDVEREGNGVVRFVCEEVTRGIVFEGSLPPFGRVRDVPDVALAFEDQIWARREVGKFLAGGVVGPRGIPNRPYRCVRRAQPPEGRALNAEFIARTQFVVGRDGIEHPNLMHVIVLVVIRIVRIQRGAIKLDVRFGFLGVQQRFLDAELLRRLVLFLRSFGPVVSVVGDTNHDFLRGNDFEDLTQVFDEPVLCRDGAGRRSQPVLVVIH